MCMARLPCYARKGYLRAWADLHVGGVVINARDGLHIWLGGTVRRASHDENEAERRHLPNQ